MTTKTKNANKLVQEAAADILRGSFQAAKAKEDKPKRISQKGEEEIGGDTPEAHNEKGLDANGAVTKAAYPGITPPVSSEPRKKLPGNEFANDQGKSGGDLPGEDGGNDSKRSDHGMSGVVVEDGDMAGKDNSDDKDRIVDGSDGNNDSDNDGDHDDADKDADQVKNMVKPGCMKEHVDALFSGEKLSEKFKLKATAIFEGAVTSKLLELAEVLQAQKEKQLAEALELVTESLVERIDSYLGYLAESWGEENELAIESGLRTELAENFITQLKTVFVENYIEIPEEKVDMVAELSETLASKEDQLNEEFKKGAELRRLYNEQVKVNLIHDITEGLTGVQKDKIGQLAEGVEFINAKDFAGKLEVLTESYIAAPKTGATELDDAANDATPGSDVHKVLNEDIEEKKAGGKAFDVNPLATEAARFLKRGSR